MSHCTFTFSANTGGALALGPFRVWYDALHQEKLPGFSTLSPALLAEMERNPAFAAPDVIFHSHCHADHFSRSLLAAARQDGFTTLRESCRELVLSGVTSAAEAARVINTAAET